MTSVPAETAATIQQILALYNHAVDNGEWDLLADEVVTPDLALTVATPAGDRDFSGPEGARGAEGLLAAAIQPAESGWLPAHHTVSTALRPTADGVEAWSRLILITDEGAAHSGDVIDGFRLTESGWRLASRHFRARNRGDGAAETGFAEWAADRA